MKNYLFCTILACILATSLNALAAPFTVKEVKALVADHSKSIKKDSIYQSLIESKPNVLKALVDALSYEHTTKRAAYLLGKVLPQRLFDDDQAVYLALVDHLFEPLPFASMATTLFERVRPSYPEVMGKLNALSYTPRADQFLRRFAWVQLKLVQITICEDLLNFGSQLRAEMRDSSSAINPVDLPSISFALRSADPSDSLVGIALVRLLSDKDANTAEWADILLRAYRPYHPSILKKLKSLSPNFDKLSEYLSSQIVDVKSKLEVENRAYKIDISERFIF